MKNYLKVERDNDGIIYLNLDKITYFKEHQKGKTEVRYMTYRLEVAYTSLSIKEIMKQSETKRIIQ